jgi:hypothetical protein
MSEIECLTWNDAELPWNSADVTWEEACVIIKIIGQIAGSNNYRPKISLTPKEKRILIGLIVKLKENESIYSVDLKKEKNNKIKVTSKDINLFLKELKEIKITAQIL